MKHLIIKMSWRLGKHGEAWFPPLPFNSKARGVITLLIYSISSNIRLLKIREDSSLSFREISWGRNYFWWISMTQTLLIPTFSKNVCLTLSMLPRSCLIERGFNCTLDPEEQKFWSWLVSPSKLGDKMWIYERNWCDWCLDSLLDKQISKTELKTASCQFNYLTVREVLVSFGHLIFPLRNGY